MNNKNLKFSFLLFISSIERRMVLAPFVSFGPQDAVEVVREPDELEKWSDPYKRVGSRQGRCEGCTKQEGTLEQGGADAPKAPATVIS
jgi:hypothetical protein